MRKCKVPGVEGRTRDQVGWRGAIKGIGQEGETKGKGMHPDLVRAPGSGNCSQ